MPIFQLSDQPVFPPAHLADESGLLAVDGRLEPDWILEAYRNGIFPWFNEGERILWWSPDPRMVLFPEKLKVSKSMRNMLNRQIFRVTFDKEFEAVIEACANVYRGRGYGTWITDHMKSAYTALHKLGIAHSVEVWNHRNELVGGLYGLAIGSCFFGESMFTRESNASKVGFIELVRWLRAKKYNMIDCQVASSHLQSLGAEEISRSEFLKLVEAGVNQNFPDGKWSYLT